MARGGRGARRPHDWRNLSRFADSAGLVSRLRAVQPHQRAPDSCQRRLEEVQTFQYRTGHVHAAPANEDMMLRSIVWACGLLLPVASGAGQSATGDLLESKLVRRLRD